MDSFSAKTESTIPGNCVGLFVCVSELLISLGLSPFYAVDLYAQYCLYPIVSTLCRLAVSYPWSSYLSPVNMTSPSTFENCDTEKYSIPEEFSSPNSNSDLILVVEERKLHVNRSVLILASPVFEKMLDGDFKENAAGEITLPYKRCQDVVDFLLCVYPSTCAPITLANLDCVASLAEEYQVQSLKQRCETFMLNRFLMRDEAISNPPNTELVHFLHLADMFDFQSLLKLCIEKTSKRFFSVGKAVDSINTIEEFNLVSLRTRYEVLVNKMMLIEVGELPTSIRRT